MSDLTVLAASIDSIRRHLDNSQWWPADILRRRQLEMLVPLVEHAYLTVPWYRQQFEKHGIKRGTDMDESSWRSLPTLSRRDIQAAGELLHSTQVPAGHGTVSRLWTSGSTATPVMVSSTDLTARVWIANSLRQYDWQQAGMEGKLAVIRNVPRGQADAPHGKSFTRWGVAESANLPSGPCSVLDVRSTIEEQAAWLVQERPTYLQTYPSIVYEIARHFIGPRKKTLTSIRRVVTYGEALDRRVRDACRRAWGVDVLDSYSANEIGHIAAQCSSCRAYHVHAEHLIIEILDDEGRPCTPGEIGRVVVTDLFNYAMPLIRYEIGDLAEAGGVCDCGRNLPTLRRILGRQRNMFVLANGQKRWPAMEVDALGAFEGRLPIRQFQAIQHGPVEIEVKLVVTRPLTAQEESGIRALLAGWFSDGLQIRFSYVPEIPRSPSGKFEDFLCEIGRRE